MAFLQPPASQQPAFNVPVSVVMILALLVAVHVLLTLLPAAQSEELKLQFAFNPALYSPAFLRSHGLEGLPLWLQILPFVSYMLLHGDLTHLAINCLWLLAFGPIVARRFGSLRFVVFFNVCGVGAALVQLFCTWGQLAPVIGASGAISGLMGAAMRMLPLAGPRETRALLPLTSSRVVMFSLVWVITNVVAGLTGFTGVGTGLRLIAWQAHLGGYACGVLLSGWFDRMANRSNSVALG
jgi:membrane associated rhomboid family serine protease